MLRAALLGSRVPAARTERARPRTPGPGQPEQAPGPRRATLVVTERSLRGTTLALGQAAVLIGRGADCTLVLDDPGVSRRHAEVRVSAQGARLSDLSSTNGTFVDGERVSSVDLFDGATITVGRTELVFRSARRDEGWT